MNRVAMTTELVRLERELSLLASEFAMQLVRAALRARVAELDALCDARALEPELFAITLDESSSRARLVQAGAARATESDGERADRPRRAGRPGPQRSARAAAAPPRTSSAPPDTDDADAAANVITDPSSLLEVLGSSTAPASNRARATSFFRDQPDSTEAQGPALRPGERLQRTAGGNVVLRRERG
jgi:hypothetical protein